MQSNFEPHDCRRAMFLVLLKARLLVWVEVLHVKVRFSWPFRPLSYLPTHCWVSLRQVIDIDLRLSRTSLLAKDGSLFGAKGGVKTNFPDRDNHDSGSLLRLG